MALLSDKDPDPTPRSTLRCDSTVGAYKHSDPDKKGKNKEVGISRKQSILNTDPSGETHSIQVSLTPAAQCRTGFEPCRVGFGSVLDRRAIARNEASFLSWLSGLSS